MAEARRTPNRAAGPCCRDARDVAGGRRARLRAFGPQARFSYLSLPLGLPWPLPLGLPRAAEALARVAGGPIAHHDRALLVGLRAWTVLLLAASSAFSLYSAAAEAPSDAFQSWGGLTLMALRACPRALARGGAVVHYTARQCTETR